ncbi:ATP adenylyltransferase [Gammaproteobacteria bacterium]|nr:ATP adenylyltransferase [Gammaproteobacteria bacterium]
MQPVAGEAGCPLCLAAEEPALWRDARCRVVLAGDADYPGFCRVVWQAHVREMSDLAAADRAHLLAVVLAVEAALRDLLSPHKINLASLGNQVPHLHWHVIPRFTDDAHFPDAVWSARRRPGHPHSLDIPTLQARLSQIGARSGFSGI